MTIISIDDLFTHLYGDTVEAISEGEDAIPQAAVDAAVDEATGYLSQFDIPALFALKPPGLANYIKDIAVWHFLVLSNQSVELEFRETRYNMAIKELEKIQSGKKQYRDWPKPVSETPRNSYISYGGNPKRSNHF